MNRLPPTKRFTGRAAVYSRYRPHYPNRPIIGFLQKAVNFDRRKVIADVGSGTGILSEVFLKNGNTVFCIEPNLEMRAVADERLRKFGPRFRSLSGSAEATGLQRASIDLVTAGQALHWFDIERARREFRRILRRDGRLLAVYNLRRQKGKVEEAYQEVLDAFGGSNERPAHVDDRYMAHFLGNNDFDKLSIPNAQRLDYEGLMGRLSSASYLPPPHSPRWKKMESKVQRILDEHGVRSPLVLHYDTVLYLGRISRD